MRRGATWDSLTLMPCTLVTQPHAQPEAARRTASIRGRVHSRRPASGALAQRRKPAFTHSKLQESPNKLRERLFQVPTLPRGQLHCRPAKRWDRNRTCRFDLRWLRRAAGAHRNGSTAPWRQALRPGAVAAVGWPGARARAASTTGRQPRQG